MIEKLPMKEAATLFGQSQKIDGKPGYSLAVSAQKLLPPPGQGPVFTIQA